MALDSLIPVCKKVEDTLKLFEKSSNVNIYGFFLNPDSKHPLAKVLENRWSELHYLTGEKVMLAATEAPKEWSDNLKAYWEANKGVNFEDFVKKYIGGEPDAGIAFQYIDIFNPPIAASQLPCLVLFNDIEDKAVVRTLPNWKEDNLYDLVNLLLRITRKCAEETDREKRLKELENLLTSPGAIILDNGKNAGIEVMDYCRQDPAKILGAGLGIALALATGNVLPLTSTMIEMLKTIKDILK